MARRKSPNGGKREKKIGTPTKENSPGEERGREPRNLP